MQFDIHRVKPTPGAVSECPSCKTKLVAKCGTVKIWHWAHESLKECDDWYEPITQWHLDWQNFVAEEYQEVIIGHHIADIKLPNGKVIEIQHSNLPVETVAEREAFYGNMIWIFDGLDFKERFIIKEKESKAGYPYNSFRFRKPRQYIVRATKFPVYIDFGDTVFEVKGFNSYKNRSIQYGTEYTSWGGWGYARRKDMFLYREIFGQFYTPKPKLTDGGTA